MKQTTRILVLAASIFAVVLLLGANTVLAAEVIIENGNVTAIKGMNLVINEDVAIYDVTFVSATAIGVYGENLRTQFLNQDDSVLAMAQVIGTLNANNPVPAGAGPDGTNQFFIGGDEENDTLVAAGAEYIEGLWDKCQAGCTGGVAVLLPVETNTFAVFSPPTALPPPPPGGGEGDIAQINIGGLLKLFALGAPPTDEYCAEQTHYGRVTVDVVNNFLYVCTQSGWKNTRLTSP